MFDQKSNIEIFNQCCNRNDLGDSLELSFSEVTPLVGIEMKWLRYLYAFNCYKDEGKIHFDHSFFEIHGVGTVKKKVLDEQGLQHEKWEVDRPYDYSYRTKNPAYLLLDESNGELKWVVYKSCSEFRKCMLALKEANDMTKLRTNYVNFWTPTFYQKESQKSLDDFMEYLFRVHDLEATDFGEYEELFKFFKPYSTAATWNNFFCQY